MRAPKSVDFWRGFALATIFINHIPGIFLERYTFRHYSLSDAASYSCSWPASPCAMSAIRWRRSR